MNPNMAGYNLSLEPFPCRTAPLENWPKQLPPSLKTSSSDGSSNNKKSRVRFSETSRLYTYQRTSASLLESLFYTRKDYSDFFKQALMDAKRIKKLIADAPHDSAAGSIKHLLRHDIISSEELIGIEHFILGKPSRVSNIRKRHSDAVLSKQQELQQQRRTPEYVESKLSEFAQSSSLKSSKNARIRAAIAA